MTRRWIATALSAGLVLASVVGCTDDDGTEANRAPKTSEDKPVVLRAGAASRSILPTVDGDRKFLDDAPAWPEESNAGGSAASGWDPDDPGVFVKEFDQGQVDVGNGGSDGSWVHDDLRATAVALERGSQRVIVISTDTYMHFAPDVDEMVRRVHAALPKAWSRAEILVAATHNHHGPDTAFSVNKRWYEELADQTADAAAAAVRDLRRAEAKVASGTHGYGVTDARDPLILDRRLNVLTIDEASSGDPIATVVQWASHPETTLGWGPPLRGAERTDACAAKGWEGDDCSADGRYFTADYPGVLRQRLMAERGGEVLYVNGAIGSQIGPGDAGTWIVDEDHPVTDDGTPPDGAEPLVPCPEGDDGGYTCQNLAKTESIGTQLAGAVVDLAAHAKAVDIGELSVTTEPFLTRLTNIGFRVLIAEGTIGWQDPTLYRCKEEVSFDACPKASNVPRDEPVLTPLADVKVVEGNAVPSRVTRLDLGDDLGMVFLPGEVPPELVIGLPDDFASNTDEYFHSPELHATGADYALPGRVLDLVDEEVTFTVGLGGDQLGYYVPVGDYRLRCLDAALPDGATCADLAAQKVIPSPEFVDGDTCKETTDDRSELQALGDDADAVAAICLYGQALGRELGEPPDHYEETNAAGWDQVTDLWSALERLYG